VHSLGGSPPRPDECRQLLAHGPRAIAELAGNGPDDAVKDALSELRAELAAVYEQARHTEHLDETQRLALSRLEP
jgi:hypothetical protein